MDLQVGQTVEVTVQKIVPGGAGLAFADGLTVFVPLSAVGDRLRVRIDRLKGKTAFAEIDEIIEPSPQRVSPPCPYFGTCGGCDLQQLSYQDQLAAKREIIRDCLHRIGKIELSDGIKMIGSPREFAYRLRAQWHIETASRSIGYYRRNSHDVIEIAECPKLIAPLNAKLADLRQTIVHEALWDPRVQVEAAAGDDGTVSVYSPELAESAADISIEAAGEKYSFNAKSFFQGNRFMLDQLIETAVGGTGGNSALDLYCGVGLFSLPLARRFKSVTGVESNASAIEYAQKNAAAAGISNVEFIADGVERFIRGPRPGDLDLVLLDPPRAGTSKETILRTIALEPRTLIYVSCEPSILARDLRWMIDRGWQIVSLVGLDLFPQTHHVETVVRLEKQRPDGSSQVEHSGMPRLNSIHGQKER